MAVSDISQPNPVSLQFVEAAVETGYARGVDFNDGEQIGAGLLQVNVRDGKRESAATAFLDPIKHTRKNLVIRNFARSRRLLIDRNRAHGVEFAVAAPGSPERIENVTADREVIVSCGSVDSPKLLMLSGIGPADHLRSFGINVHCDLPGVGQNLRDHTIIALGYHYAPGKSSSPPAAGAVEGGLFIRTRAGLGDAPPDIQFHFSHWLLIDPSYLKTVEPDGGFSLIPTLVRPQSRGSITLRSADFTDPAVIRANYLQSRTDLEALTEALKIGREILNANPLDEWRGAEIVPGRDVRNDAELQQYIRTACAGLFHPTGTCKMGHDVMAVVDPELRVRGLDGLRVVDASVMPSITSGNTHAPTVMIAEYAADMIKGAS